MEIKALEEACNKNGFELIFVQNKKEALEKAKEYITPNVSIGLGGSVSIEEIGLLEYLESRKDITLFNQYEEGISYDENIRRRKNGLTADIFVSSTNAITHKGELVNCDGSGNRVAGQIFGSEKLLIIAGVNKIVKDISEAFDRIKHIAAEKNAERLNKKALTYGKQANANAQNISKKYGIITSETPNRIKIILVNETLGY